MLFVEKIRQLRDDKQIPQRQIAALLEIDTATYCKIEKGDRRAKRDQVVVLSEFFGCKDEELLKIWLADQIYEVVKNEKEAQDVLALVKDKVVAYGKK